MLKNKKNINLLVIIAGLLFIVINSFLITKEVFFFSVLPVVLLVLLLYVISLDKVILLIAFVTPFSVNISDFIEMGDVGISMPAEPMLILVLVLSIFKFLFTLEIDKRILKHPVTIAIIIYLLWTLITSITSELPAVSFKSLLAKLWFIVPLYFVGVKIFKEKKNIDYFIWAYAIALMGVIIYTTYQHSLWGFQEQPAHWVMSPFYNDHTAYGAIIAMYIPVIAYYVLDKSLSVNRRIYASIALGILGIGLVLSISRAAWVSVAAAIGLLVVIVFKIKTKWLVLVFAVILGLFIINQEEILYQMGKNDQDSSDDLTEHVQSISNISTDASNLERINRWNSALRLFADKPVLGWGPGTYQFVYAPYQHSYERTIISTNAGDKGTAHSEYFLPMAEQGFMGLLCFLAVIITSLISAFRVYRRANDNRIRYLSLALMLSLTTYYVHALLNNFLDTDKAAVPFWGFTAIIVCLDIFYTNKEKKVND